MDTLKQLIHEIHRRSLWQVLGIFLATGWGVLQVVEFLTVSAGLPDWTPTMAVVLGMGGLPFDKLGTFNAALLLHGAQKIELFDEIPAEGEIESVGTIGAIWDKGKGAVVEMESESINVATGKPLLKTRMSVFIRGEGGFGRLDDLSEGDRTGGEGEDRCGVCAGVAECYGEHFDDLE